MDALRSLGFIDVKPKPGRKFGYILVLHPHDVVRALRDTGRVPNDWWELFESRLCDMGAELRAPPVIPDVQDTVPERTLTR